MDLHVLALVAFAVLAFGVVSGRIETTPLTSPMVFVAVGLVLSPAALGLLDFEAESPLFHLLAELTLVLVLFTDASRINLRRLVREHRIPVRMLAIGLPSGGRGDAGAHSRRAAGTDCSRLGTRGTDMKGLPAP